MKGKKADFRSNLDLKEQLPMLLLPLIMIVSLLFYGGVQPAGMTIIIVLVIIWSMFSLYRRNLAHRLFLTGHLKLFLLFSALLLIYICVTMFRFAPVKHDVLDPMIFYAVMIFFVFVLVQERPAPFFVFSVIYVLAFLELILGLVQLILGFHMTGSFFTPNIFADFLILGFFCGTEILKDTAKKLKIPLFLSLFIFFAMILISGSRGAYLSLITVLIFMALRKKRVMLAIVVLAFSFAVVLFFNNPIKDKIFSEKEKSPFIWDRIKIWKTSGAMIGASPFFGYGLGQFKYGSSRYRQPIDYYVARYPKRISHPHNLFLYIVTTLGFIGFLMVLMLPFLLLFYYRPGREAYGLLALLVHSLVNDSLVVPGLLISVLIIFASRLEINQRFREPFRFKRAGWIAASLLLLLLVGELILLRWENAATVAAPGSKIELPSMAPGFRFKLIKTATFSYRLEYLESQRLGTLFNGTGNREFLVSYAYRLESSLKLNPFFKKARLEYLRFLSQFKSGDLKEVFEENLEEMIFLDPYDVFSMEFAGDLQHGSGRPEEAMDYYKRAVELEPNFAAVWMKMGLIESNEKIVRKAKNINKEYFPDFSYISEGVPVHLYEYRLLDLNRVNEEDYEK